MNRQTAYYRARGGSDDPLFSGEGSRASRAKDEGQEEKNPMKAAGYPGDPAVPGHNWAPSPRIGGRGSRAHAHRLAKPRICGGWSP